MLFEWIAGLFSWLTSSKDHEHRALRDERDALREDRDAIREDLVSVMKAYQALNQDLQAQITALREEVEELGNMLRKERAEHAACQRKLDKHADEIRALKIQVRELMIKEDKRDG